MKALTARSLRSRAKAAARSGGRAPLGWTRRKSRAGARRKASWKLLVRAIEGAAATRCTTARTWAKRETGRANRVACDRYGKLDVSSAMQVFGPISGLRTWSRIGSHGRRKNQGNAVRYRSRAAQILSQALAIVNNIQPMASGLSLHGRLLPPPKRGSAPL